MTRMSYWYLPGEVVGCHVREGEVSSRGAAGAFAGAAGCGLGARSGCEAPGVPGDARAGAADVDGAAGAAAPGFFAPPAYCFLIAAGSSFGVAITAMTSPTGA